MISTKVRWYTGERRLLAEWYLRTGETKVLGVKFAPQSLSVHQVHISWCNRNRTDGDTLSKRPTAEKVQNLRRYFLVDRHLTERSYQLRMNRAVSSRSNSETVTVLSPQISLVENLTHTHTHTHTTSVIYASFMEMKWDQYKLRNRIQSCNYSRSEYFGITHKRVLTRVVSLVSRYWLKNASLICMHRASSYNMCMNQKDAQNSCD